MDQDKDGDAPYPMVRLKRGVGEMRGDLARFWEKKLRRLLETEPEMFRALEAIADGHQSEVDKERLFYLRKNNLLMKNHDLLPDVRTILAAGLLRVPDGAALADPILTDRPEDLEVVNRIEDRLKHAEEEGLKHLAKELRRDNGKQRGR